MQHPTSTTLRTARPGQGFAPILPITLPSYMRRGACQRCLKQLNHRLFSLRSPPIKPSAFHTRHRIRHCPPQARTLIAREQHGHDFHRSGTEYKTLNSSYSTSILTVIFLGASAFLLNSLFQDVNPAPAPSSIRDIRDSAPTTSNDPFFTDMPIPPGHRGNLTAEQEVKLREFWALALRTFGVQDPTNANGNATPAEDTPVASEVEAKDEKKKKRRSMFSRKHGDTGSSPSKHADDSEDKYGQGKEFQHIVSTQSPESLRDVFWSMVKGDHPDALFLRFLRARKWDVDKALVMMIATMSWRGQEIHVDDDIVYQGELGAWNDSKSSDANVKREGHDFLEQMRLGKSFLHGTDKEGRPLCIVRARLHHGGDQTERSMERYTVYVIETARLVLRPPVETAVSQPLRYCPCTI